MTTIGLPTLDRPFGIALWPLFERAFTPIMGYKPQDFHFVPGQTPMSTKWEVATMLISYYIVILGGRELMRGRAPLSLNFFFKVHNLYLTIISGALLALFLEQLIPILARHGVFYAICNHKGGWTKELVILYYLNYLTKYLELIDTVFLFLKKKPLTFLHTYHHGATALLCYSQLLGHTSVSWVPITLNLTVHVVMYWYYFQAARGIRIWWKKYITILQITQFVIDLGFVYYARYVGQAARPRRCGFCDGSPRNPFPSGASGSGVGFDGESDALEVPKLRQSDSSYTYFAATYFPWMPNHGSCAGEEFAAFAGMGILSSYLLLFLSFYAATYKKPAPKKGGRGRSVSALVEMKDERVPTLGETKRRLSGAVRDGSEKINGIASGMETEAETPRRVTRSRKA